MTDEIQPTVRRGGQKPMIIIMSQTLMCWGHAALVIGQMLAVILQKIFDLEAWPVVIGIPSPILILLVPIWTLLSAGVLVSLAAWIAHPEYHQKLDLSETHDIGDDEFSPFTRHLGGFTAALVCVAGIGSLCFLLTQDVLDLRAIAGVYSMICLTGFICYLVWGHDKDRDKVTNNYLMMLWVLWAFALIPLTWPLVIYLNVRQRRRNGEVESTAMN